MVLMGSDLLGHQHLLKGNAVSLALMCSSEDEIRKWYGRLAAGGATTQPLETNHWGILLGELQDKYGNHWMLHFKP